MHHPPHSFSLAAALLASACAGSQAPPLPAPVEAVVWIPHVAPATPEAAARDPELGPRRHDAPRRAGRQPNHFWFVYLDDIAERRDWVRVLPSIWEERYPNGAATRFRVVGRLDDGSRAGIVVRRALDEAMEVFIPDLGTDTWAQFRVSPGGDWHPLGQMHLIE